MALKKNFIYNIILNFSNVLFPFITVPYVSRILGAEGVGTANFVLTYSGYFALMAALGIPLYGVREIAKVNDSRVARSKVFSEMFYISVISSILFSVIYLFTILFIPKLNNEKELIFVAGISLFFSSFSIDWFFSGREKFALITIRSVVVKFLALIALFLFVKTKSDILPYLFVMVFSMLANQLWTFSYAIKKEVDLSFKNIEVKKHIKPVLLLFLSSIAISIYTVMDTLLLGFMSVAREVGFYTSAIKISRLLLPFVTSLGVVLLPQMAKHSVSKNTREIQSLIGKSFSFIVFGAVPITIFLFFISPVFVPFFFGDDFMGAIIPMRIISVIVTLVGISNLAGVQVLISHGFDKYFLKAVIVGTIVNFVTNIILIPRLGAIGSSIASVSSELMVTIVTVIFIKKLTNIILPWKDFIKAIVSASVFIPFYFLLANQTLHPFIFLMLFAIIGFFFYLLVQGLVFKNDFLLQNMKRLNIFRTNKSKSYE